MPEKGLTLDVGCGEHPSGDVNCDLFIKDTGHWTGKIVQEHVLKTKKVPNFIICDSQYLPFKSGTFETVHCSHVIEHVKEPFRLFKELTRVSNCKTVIKCPHKLGERMFLPKNPFHLNFFNRQWFVAAAARAGIEDSKLQTYVSRRKYFPSEFFCILSVPFEITTVIDKSKESYSESRR